MSGYQYKAHKTRYANIEFRSRLEATWAAFFDLAGWKWKYEPFDLTGWSPDFEISHVKHMPSPIPVEVKPDWEMANDAVSKILASNVSRAMLLANGPGVPDGWADDQIMTFDHKPGTPMGVVLYLAAGDDRYENQALTFCPRFVKEHLWAEATNLTRWKPGQ